MPHLSQTLSEYVIAPRLLRLLLGFRLPPSPTTPGTGHLSAPSTIPLAPVRGSTFWDSTRSRRSVSALRDSVTHPRIVSTLLHQPPAPPRLTKRLSIYTPVETKGQQKGEEEEPPTPTPAGAGTATPAATYATAAPSATGISTLTARPAAGPTIGTADSTATQTRVAIWIQLEQGNRTWLRRQESLAVFYQAGTARMEGQIAQTER